VTVIVDSTRPVEEQALFNPALLALMMRRAAEEHEQRAGGRLLPVMLTYLAAPLALHGPTRRQLPTYVTTQMGEWIRNHPDASAGLAVRVRALRPLVSAGLTMGLRHGLLIGEPGALRAAALRRRPRGMTRSAEVDACIDKSGFLGRWFAEQPDALTLLALWGLRP
jgi:hypothetical protein